MTDSIQSITQSDQRRDVLGFSGFLLLLPTIMYYAFLESQDKHIGDLVGTLGLFIALPIVLLAMSTFVLRGRYEWVNGRYVGIQTIGYLFILMLFSPAHGSTVIGQDGLLYTIPLFAVGGTYYLLRDKTFIWDDTRFVGILLLLPSVLFIIVLVGFPFSIAIAFSFSDVIVGNTDLKFVGFDNFVNVIENDIFRQVLWNTTFFTIASQVFIIIFANILAVIFTQEFRGKWFARFLFILPWATPVSLAVIGWLWIFDNKYSPLDYLFLDLGIMGPNSLLEPFIGPERHLNWLGTPDLSQFAVIFVQVWRMTPLATVILMAGLSSIPNDILDQAKVDGSRFFRTLFQVKLPLIMPIMVIAVLFSLITMFSDMTVVYILTRGGPIDYTRVLGLYSFQIGIEGGNLAQGAAMALFIFPLLLALAIAMLRMASRSEVL